jgi:hypothetical protein
MPFARIAALLLLGSILVQADDITLTDGTVFKNAKVVAHNEKSVTISFAGGVAMVKVELVPPLLLQEPILKNFPGTAATTPVVPAPPVEISSKIKEATDKGAMQVSGIVLEDRADGLIVDLGTVEWKQVEIPHREVKTVNIVPEGLGHTPVNQTVVKKWTTTETVPTRRSLGTVFVACKTGNAADDEAIDRGTPWSGRVWHVGTYSNLDEDGVRHACDRYTTYPKEAYAYFAAHPGEIPAPSPAPPTNAETKQTPVQTSTSLSTKPMNP